MRVADTHELLEKGVDTMSTVAREPAETGTLSRTVLWSILCLVLLADALDMIDATVTNIAAPTIVGDIGGGETLVKWMGAAYTLALGVLLVLGGRLGDKFGQRRLFLVGIAGFTVASTVCGLAPDPITLLVARAAQGAFGALLIPQGMAILTKTFPREMLRTAFSLFGPLLGVASIGGPVLAGFVIDADIAGLSWRPIFLINLVLGLAGFFAALKLLPRDTGDRTAVIDAVGSGLLAAAVFGLMIGVTDGSTNGWTALPISCIVAGTVFFGLFVLRQKSARNPLIKPTLLANRGFTFGMLTGLVVFAVVSGFAYVISLFMQQALHATPMQASLGLLPLTVGIIVAAFACMALIGRLGRTLILIGLLIILAGAGWMLALVVLGGATLSLWALAPAVLVLGLGMGTCFGTIFDVTLGDIAPDEAGSASGSLTAVQQIATGIGSATVTSVYFHAAPPGDPTAMATTLIVVLALTALCLPLVALLPRHAQPEHDQSEAPTPG